MKRVVRTVIVPLSGGGREIFGGTVLFPAKNLHVIDVGANNGWYTFLASLTVGVNGQVYAFEPELRNFKILLSVCRLNALRNVILLKLALSDKDGTEKLYLSTSPTMHSLSLQRSGETIDIRVVRLDTLLHLGLIGSVDLIKIDVEGAELKVLRGSEKVLSQFEPILSIDVNHYTGEFSEVAAFLERIDYTILPLAVAQAGPMSIVAYPLSKKNLCQQLIIATLKP